MTFEEILAAEAEDARKEAEQAEQFEQSNARRVDERGWF